MDKTNIIKSAAEIKLQILKRFNKLTDYDTTNFKNSSNIIHFEDLPIEGQDRILNKFEFPVIISNVASENFLLLTTENFHYIENSKYEKLPLTDFEWGTPDEEEEDKYYEETGGIIEKEEGHIINFHLHRKENKDLIIKIFSGSGLFALWNTFRVIELIGRKYIIEEYQEKTFEKY